MLMLGINTADHIVTKLHIELVLKLGVLLVLMLLVVLCLIPTIRFGKRGADPFNILSRRGRQSSTHTKEDDPQ